MQTQWTQAWRWIGRPGLYALVVLLWTVGCSFYPDSGERVEDDVVFTGYAQDVDFGSFRTFAIDPTMHVATVQADSSVDMSAADDTMSQRVNDHVAKRLEDRGYKRVEFDDDPDLGVNVTAISGLTVGAVSGGYWWGAYSDYWGYPGWSYYYPYDVYYSYRPGSLVVDIADLNRARGEQPAMDDAATDASAAIGGLAVVWTMVGYKAFIDDDDDARVQSANDAIDRAFEQSPYLERQ